MTEAWDALLQPAPEGARFAVRLTPKGGRDALEGLIQDDSGRWAIKARVAAPPEDGAANAALIRLIAKALGAPRGAVRICSGETARLKILAAGLPPQEAAAALKRAMNR